MRNVILIAPPAAGKGTQAKLIASTYNIPHISTGDLLRKEINDQSEIGLQVKAVLDSGKLVSDDIVLKLLENRIIESDCLNGYILDGFPRTLVQAENYLNLVEKLNYPLGDVIYINLPKEEARKRIVGRLSCSNCGAIYNDQFEDMKPINFETCDKCGKHLTKRADDTDQVFNERFKTYEDQTLPLIAFFTSKGTLFTVNSGINKEATFADVKKVINRGNIWLQLKKQKKFLK